MTLLFTTIIFWANTSFYTLQFTDIDGNIVSMSRFAGKKVLLVNISTDSKRADQLAGLQQLHQQYGDSLAIIGFPSNSFNKESRSNAGIKQYCQSKYGISFLIASKNPIEGPQIQPVYDWLSRSSKNGVMNDPIMGNFQKFLISKTGELIGVFSPTLSPLSKEIISAIEN